MLTEYDLTGKVALITGAGRGIGTGIAEVLAESGADMAINARTPRYVEPFARKLTERTGRQIVPAIGDITVQDLADDMISGVLSQFGRVDILVNNLGDSIRSPLVGLPDDGYSASLPNADIGRVLELNLLATIYCAKAIGKHMLERGSGKVINISSFAAIRGRSQQSIYSASKAGVVGFTRSLALEWAPYGVQVNGIAPGIFPDPATVGEDGYLQAVEDARDRIPVGRVGYLREVGLLAAYLSSDASNYMTGQVLPLDGGLTI